MCTKCEKKWIYYANTSCKNKYEKSNNTTPVCEDYIIVNGESSNICIERSPSSVAVSKYVSPISFKVTSSNKMKPIINLINNILHNDGNSFSDF